MPEPGTSPPVVEAAERATSAAGGGGGELLLQAATTHELLQAVAAAGAHAGPAARILLAPGVYRLNETLTLGPDWPWASMSLSADFKFSI